MMVAMEVTEGLSRLQRRQEDREQGLAPPSDKGVCSHGSSEDPIRGRQVERGKCRTANQPTGKDLIRSLGHAK